MHVPGQSGLMSLGSGVVGGGGGGRLVGAGKGCLKGGLRCGGGGPPPPKIDPNEPKPKAGPRTGSREDANDATSGPPPPDPEPPGPLGCL